MCFNVRTSERAPQHQRHQIGIQFRKREFHEQQMSCVHVAYLISIITFVHCTSNKKRRAAIPEHWLHENWMESVDDVRSFIFHSLHTHYTLVLPFFSLFYSILILIVKCLCLYFIPFCTHFHNVLVCVCAERNVHGFVNDHTFQSRAEHNNALPCHAMPY